MRKDLIEAYRGYYESEWEQYFRTDYTAYVVEAARREFNPVESWELWLTPKIEAMIRSDTPKQRLHVYLTWNGIIGYTKSIYAIATGEIE